MRYTPRENYGFMILNNFLLLVYDIKQLFKNLASNMMSKLSKIYLLFVYQNGAKSASKCRWFTGRVPQIPSEIKLPSGLQRLICFYG